MNKSRIFELKLRRSEYVNKKNTIRSIIKKSEREYESLIEFKCIVLRSQEEFYAINSNKSSVLSCTVNVQKNSNTSQKYFNGMKSVLGEVGSKIGVVYSKILEYISKELKKCEKLVNDSEDEIRRCERKIAEIDRQIKEAEKLIMGGDL